MLRQVDLRRHISHTHTPKEGIGFEIQFAVPLFDLRDDCFYNCCCIRRNLGGRFSNNGILHDDWFLYGWQLSLIGYEYHTSISHLLEEEIVHLLPYLTTVQCSQFYDTVVDMRIRVMIFHQSGFFLQDGNYFILADKSRILNL